MKAGRLIVWGVAAASVLGVLGFGALSFRRSQGEGRVERTLARLETDALVAAERRIRDALGHVDPETQSRIRAFLPTLPEPLQTRKHAAELRWYLDGEEPPPGLLVEQAERRAWMTQAIALLKPPHAKLGAVGWFGELLEQGPYRADLEIYPQGLWNVFHLSTWLQWEALLQEDPQPALEQLQKLHSALQPALVGMDSIFASGVLMRRDETIVHLALRDRISPASERRWWQERAGDRESLRQAYEGELLLMWKPWAKLFLHRPHEAYRGIFGREVSTGTRIRLQWEGGHDIARILRAYGTWISFLRGGSSLKQARNAVRRISRGGHLAQGRLVDFEGMRHLIVHRRLRHRLVRLLVCLRRVALERGRLPRDADELTTFLDGRGAPDPSASDWDIAITYERLSPYRFRFSVDPEGPLPPDMEAQRLEFRAATRSPSFDARPAVIEDLGVEVELPSLRPGR